MWDSQVHGRLPSLKECLIFAIGKVRAFENSLSKKARVEGFSHPNSHSEPQQWIRVQPAISWNSFFPEAECSTANESL